jgi:hypothetical protein
MSGQASLTDDQARALVEAKWTSLVTTAVHSRDCAKSIGGHRCADVFVELAPDRSTIESGQLEISTQDFAAPSADIRTQIESRATQAGLEVKSVEVDNVGVAVPIVRLATGDPSKAVGSKAAQTVVADLGLAATLVEIDDSQGNLVSISGVCDLGNDGVGWTAPEYRQLENAPGPLPTS